MNLDLVRELGSRGYTYHGADSIRGKECTYACKSIPDTERHHVSVKEWRFYANDHEILSYEVEMVVETKNEVWANIKFYAISEKELLMVLPALEKRLYSAALSMGANPQHYRYDGRN